ncbi:NF-kappa-B inhibitor alpha [Pelobates cultripes]|uniref:NF-kappa-B inhibitor alpha n=1 Tax=Pelobates cultripes TaxID=61616 RepID=A0AAD1TKL4_PELCU|nr:NF-kappa-B inhibitor alpha [Pelobates cultripes]
MSTRYMDYTGNSMEGEMRDLKKDKLIQQEDRIDSGLDSLKQEEYDNFSQEFGGLCIKSQYSEPEPWMLYCNEDGDTFLNLAIIHEEKKITSEAIAHSLRHIYYLNQQNHLHQTALHLAVITDQPEIAQQLLKAGCDPEIRDFNGDTALHIACKKGSLHAVGVILQNCFNKISFLLQAVNYDGHTCLHLAAIHGFLAIVESLISVGADIDAQEPCNGRTALHIAVDLQNANLVKLLLEKGADVNRVTYQGYSPCQLTWGRSNLFIQQMLVSRTKTDLQLLPESDDESSDSESEYADEVLMYDDCTLGGKRVH